MPGADLKIDNMPVAMAMLLALQDTFPCDQKGGR
jgi:hypothetical protein